MPHPTMTAPIIRTFEVKYTYTKMGIPTPVQVLTLDSIWAEPKRIRQIAFATVFQLLATMNIDGISGFEINSITRIKEDKLQ